MVYGVYSGAQRREGWADPAMTKHSRTKVTPEGYIHPGSRNWSGATFLGVEK